MCPRVPGHSALTTLVADAALVTERRLERQRAHALEVLSRRVLHGPVKKQLRLVKDRIRILNGLMSTWCETLSGWMVHTSLALHRLEVGVRRHDAWVKQQRRKGGVLRRAPPCHGCHCRTSSLPSLRDALFYTSDLMDLVEMLAVSRWVSPFRPVFPSLRPGMTAATEPMDPEIIDALARTMGLQLGGVEEGIAL